MADEKYVKYVKFSCRKCDADRNGYQLYPGRTHVGDARLRLYWCKSCWMVSLLSIAGNRLYGSEPHKSVEAACKAYESEFRKPGPSVTSPEQSASVGNTGILANLFDELMVAPDEHTFSYRDRIVLVSNDGVEFFTHATIVSHSSPILRAFFHGKYDAKEAESELAARILVGDEYRSFKLVEADRQTVEQMLRFVYLNELPSASAQLGPLIEVCHFLQIERFLCRIDQIIEKAVNQKTLTADDWWHLTPYLIKFDCRKAFDVTIKAASKK